MIKREMEFESTAGEAFCGSASIPEPILVPITRATAPALLLGYLGRFFSGLYKKFLRLFSRSFPSK
jgi:hypothetical protein